MAHTCPDCGCTCHCKGDIDDICFGERYDCDCCEKDDDVENEDWECPYCGEWNGDHTNTCPIRNPLYD